jgi:hypothetical protein
MAGMLFPDIAGALSSGAQAGAASAQNQYLMKDRAARDEIAPLIPRALQGDREALNQIGTRHPDTLMKIAPLLDRADAATRTRAKEASEWTTKAAMGVLSLPPEQRPAAYQAALAEGQRLGYQIDMPPQYDRAVEGRLNQVINQARPIADYFKSQNEGPQAMPPPGGGMAAPGASGDLVARTKQVIGGMESSNRYDAVGPDTGGGKKALGKYQVMDFNVGPWTQEALGRALTPEQFLASPQAQEAVADFKLGQYIKQFGSPEAAARAWFAGAGGMNNAGAKDVLGTSVQGYGQKFAQAFGPGATGSQVAQGDAAPRADASGNPLPPPVAAPGAMIGGEIDDIRRQVRANGGDLFSKGGQLEIQNGNYVVRSIQNPRQIIGMVPVKPAKEPGAGPFTGTGTEAQALNMLIANGTLTPQQAAELAAGKTVTDPETKQIIFMTPSGIFGGRPGQPPQPIAGPSPGMAAPAPMPSAGSPAGVPAPAAPAVTVPANPGALPLTGTQAKGQPSATEMAKLRSARVEADKITAAANDFKTEWAKATPAERARSLAGANTPLNASYNNFALLAKGDALFQLGVLNGPDLDIIRRTIPDPSTWKSIMTSEDDVTSSVDKVLNILNNGVSSTERQLGITQPQGAQGKQTAKPGTYLGPDNSPISWPEIEATAKNRGITTDEVVNRLGLKPTGMQ